MENSFVSQDDFDKIINCLRYCVVSICALFIFFSTDFSTFVSGVMAVKLLSVSSINLEWGFIIYRILFLYL
jgi:hypothetical protein